MIDLSYIIPDMFNLKKETAMKIDNAIFYIKYYAKKHDCIIERKATLDDECYEGTHKKLGYPYKKYIDINATEEVGNGKPQYRTASVKWEINEQPTLTE
jgi:hypothetical protein|tara:strand:- start:94 stop:390 length:297 start_codon:yes stop_codon:yes gene_type:complete